VLVVLRAVARDRFIDNTVSFGVLRKRSELRSNPLNLIQVILAEGNT
jgi:hypothetical protein